jgi:hypothetical protein
VFIKDGREADSPPMPILGCPEESSRARRRYRTTLSRPTRSA